MAFPSRDRTQGFADLLSRAKVEANSVKQSFNTLAGLMATSRRSTTDLIKAAGMIAALRMELVPLTAKQGMDAYASKEIGRGVVADAQALLALADAALAEIKKLIPASPDGGWLLACRFDTDGSLSWRNYSPEEMQPVRAALQQIADAIE